MPAEDYEAMIASFVRNSLDPARSGIFFDDFAATAKPIIAAGEILSLSQLALKLFGPGIPDIYQGTELWDLSLVDPDNRRPVDFAHRLALIEQSANHTGDSGGAQRKFALMRNGLAVRQRLDLSSAEYVPLTVSGPAEESLVAFARARQEQGIVVIAARRCRAIVETARASAMWNQSRVTLPPAAVSGSLLNVGSTQRVRIEDQRIDLSTVLGADTVAILEWGATSTS